VGYSEEAFRARNPLAWPLFATVEDLVGFPPSVIQVNECDPLRDEGVTFYRRLVQAGVTARCVELMGTTHAAETMIWAVPEITQAAAAAIANFATH
jgi:acetyl esterase/lipase